MNQLTDKEQKIAQILREKLTPNNATLNQHNEILMKMADPNTPEGQNFMNLPEANKLQSTAGLNYTKGYCSGMKEGINFVLQLMNMDEQELQDWIEEEAAMRAEEEKRMQDIIQRGTGGRGLRR